MNKISNNYPVHGTSVLSPRYYDGQTAEFTKQGKVIKFPSDGLMSSQHFSAPSQGSNYAKRSSYNSNRATNRTSSTRFTSDRLRSGSHSFDYSADYSNTHISTYKNPYTNNVNYSKTEAAVFTIIGMAVSLFFVLI